MGAGSCAGWLAVEVGEEDDEEGEDWQGLPTRSSSGELIGYPVESTKHIQMIKHVG